MSKQDLEDVSSPCVSICALNDEDVCVGCYRTGTEITQWWSMDNSEKQQTIEKAKEREVQSYI